MRKSRRNIVRPWLLPLTPFYWIGVTVRNLMFDLRLLKSVSFPHPLISVGNITAGGTGKTPHVEMLVRFLKKDHRVAVLSRGYKRKSSGFVMAAGHSRVSDIGDEPLQIKLKFPGVVVAADGNRVRGVTRLLHSCHRPDVIILDDAYQHRYIRPGLSILLIDYNRPVFRDFLLPAGNLREPARNSRRADLVIVTKCLAGLSRKKKQRFIEKLHLNPLREVYFTTYTYKAPVAVYGDDHENRSSLSYRHLRKSHAGILLVAGVADPKPLLKFLKEIHCVQDCLFYPDHHSYDQEDIRQIAERFLALPGETRYILVTEKDAVKFREVEIADQLKNSLYYVPVETEFLDNGEKLFHKRISRYVRKAARP